MPEYIQSKSILSKLKDAPDPYFGISYNMNLYRGCQHQCIYCDSRSTIYGLGDLAKIRIKANAINLLETELRGKRIKATIGTGSMNDPYMPIEKNERLTRRALQVIYNCRFPVHILTKSDLVVRDIDLLEEIKKVYAAISFTITTHDDSLSSNIEPGAVISSKRFKAIEELAKKGLYCGVLLTPVLPFITDNSDNIIETIKRAKNSGASYILCWMGMTQRNGQREFYYDKLDHHFPGLRNKYAQEFGLNYNCPVPKADELYQVFKETCNEVQIPMKMRFFEENLPQQLNIFQS